MENVAGGGESRQTRLSYMLDDVSTTLGPICWPSHWRSHNTCRFDRWQRDKAKPQAPITPVAGASMMFSRNMIQLQVCVGAPRLMLSQTLHGVVC